MMARLVFIAARLMASAVFLLTWAYGVTARSAFAFDMFVKPQLSPTLVSFVNWHPAMFGLAFLLSSITLVQVIRRPAAIARHQYARIAAIGYVIVFGGVTWWLTQRPYLASLGAGDANLMIVPGALLPIFWLAMIDHLGATRGDTGKDAAGFSQQALLRATVASAIILWSAHLAWSALKSDGLPPTIAGAAWSLLLDLAAAQVAYLVFAFASTIAAGANRRIEYGIVAIAVAIALAEFARQIVLPPLAFSNADRAIIAVPFGFAIVALWSGLRISGAARVEDGGFALFASQAVHPLRQIGLIAAALIAAAYATAQIERLDWAFILRQAIAAAEALVIFALILPLVARGRRSGWSLAALIGPPLVVGAALFLAPLSAASPSLRAVADPQNAVERAIAGDPLARMASSVLVSREPLDSTFFRTLLDDEASLWSAAPAVPGDALTPIVKPATAPHVFVIVLDSLRRDYLSPYNPAVTFTPAIQQWARDSFVFRNAFTPYGGTAQAMPALWTGRSVPRGWARIMKEINSLEHLIGTVGFDFLINDHTVRTHLNDAVPRTFLNPYVASPNTDLCLNFEAVRTHLQTRQSAAPVFAFLAPMNVHILNTLVGTPAKDYPGFHAPYAAQLERADACFGSFIAYLKSAGLFDNSIVVVTSDHGDSLGEGNRWGHQSYLFPEIMRIPLIVGVPAALRSQLTTDLSRVAFLSDITPTLTNVITGRARDGDPPDGGVLLQPADADLRSRRRRAFMLMSSYGPVFGVVRKNGRSMYVTDLRDWQEHSFELDAVGYREVPVTSALRQASQAALLEDFAAVKRLYHRPP